MFVIQKWYQLIATPNSYKLITLRKLIREERTRGGTEGALFSRAACDHEKRILDDKTPGTILMFA